MSHLPTRSKHQHYNKQHNKPLPKPRTLHAVLFVDNELGLHHRNRRILLGINQLTSVVLLALGTLALLLLSLVNTDLVLNVKTNLQLRF